MSNKKMSQKIKVLRHLKSGKAINPMTAINQYGAYRLSAIIKNLRDEGHPIVTETAVVKNKRGQRMNLARYRMVA